MTYSKNQWKMAILTILLDGKFRLKEQVFEEAKALLDSLNDEALSEAEERGSKLKGPRP